MGLREGYKQTEVGIIPEDWNVKDLGEVASFTNGKAHEQCIDDMGEFIVVNSKFISTQGAVSKNSSQCISPLRKGDITMVMSDIPNGKALAKCYTIPKSNMYTLNQRICSVSSKFVDNDFLGLILNRNKYYLSFDSGTGQTNLRRQDVLDCPLPLPPTKTEQTAIANALSDADAWIQSLTRLIAKKRQIKQGTMQTLLNPYENGRLKVGWVVKKLGDVAHFINGRAYSLTEWETQGTPVIRLQNLTGRGEKYYYSNLWLPEKQYCVAGDLLFMWSATFGPVIWEGEKAIYHYHIWKIECKPVEANKKYLFYMLDDLTERLKKSSSSGGTMLHVTKEKMESTEIISPNIDEQTKIATILSDMDNEITALETKLTKAQKIKQGMMQNLLTGKIRLIGTGALAPDSADRNGARLKPHFQRE